MIRNDVSIESKAHIDSIDMKLNSLREQNARFSVLLESFQERIAGLEKKYDHLILLSVVTLSSILCGVAVYLFSLFGSG